MVDSRYFGDVLRIVDGLRTHKCQHGQGEPIHETLDRDAVMAILHAFAGPPPFLCSECEQPWKRGHECPIP